ncbi:MAG TPA: glutathione peroxidase [Magnetospirillaceae bacterium]|nr:glutathione peroxidase [Magnetospirillaceae bacterium]
MAKGGSSLLGALFGRSSAPEVRSAWDFTFVTIDGQPLPLSRFEGQAVLVVNTASQCGFTPQYAGLQSLHRKYRDRGLVVLGVPSNDFGAQEPGNSTEIQQFCDSHFGIEFHLTEKVRVTGDEAHPFFLWAAQEMGPLAQPRWNFHKYLIAPDGRLVDWFSSATEPEAQSICHSIETHLPR